MMGWRSRGEGGGGRGKGGVELGEGRVPGGGDDGMEE